MNAAVVTLLAALAVGQQPVYRHQSANFVVHAADAETARRVAEAAERCRTELTKGWLGAEPEDWPSPCRIEVDTAGERLGGSTDVTYRNRQVFFPRLRIKGPLDRLLTGPLPHELTHLLFAHHFGFRVPRWADEGGAILGEDDGQRGKHAKGFDKFLAEERRFPLRKLLDMKDYPADLACFYGQSYSFSEFLVATKGRRAFLDFVGTGPTDGWDGAAQAQYGFQTVEQLEQAWLDWTRRPRDKDAQVPAQATMR